MNTLDRYLYRTVLVYTLLAMAVLLALGALVLFISQQGEIGIGSYTAGDAFLFTLLNLPQQAFELLPIGAMLGALMGLGNLAAGSELIVTRASGVSVWRIGWPVGLAGMTLALLMYGIGEFAAPPLRSSRSAKRHARAADASFAGQEQRLGQGWQPDFARGTSEVVRPSAAWSSSSCTAVAPAGDRAGRPRIVPDPGRWRLHNVATTRSGPDQIRAHRPPS